MSGPARKIALFGGIASLVAAVACLSAYFLTSPSPGLLNYKIFNKKTVMTFAYKAYASERSADGKYWLARVVLDNNGGQPLRDVKVSYRIPDYMDWTTPDESAELLPGQTKVFPIYPKLPNKVTQTRSRTPALLELKIAYADSSGKAVEKIEKREFEFRGVNEIEYSSLPDSEIVDWYDMFANNEIVAAYVTDEDDVVKQYLGKISETQGGVNVISNGETLMKFLKSCYDFQVQTGMTYAAAKGIPEKIGDTTAIVQSVRLPRDVIQQNSGLCIELAILQASLAQAAGAKAYLVLIPGHCYPLLEAGDGTRIAIESTGIGGANLGGVMSFEDAVKTGMKEFQQVVSGQLPACIIDVSLQHSRGLRPPELDRVDVTAIVKMLADRTANAKQGGTVMVNNNRPEANGGQGGGQAGGNMAMASFRGNFGAVPYPANFVTNAQALAAVRQVAPFFAFAAADPQNRTGLEVFEFNSNDLDDCLTTLINFGGQLGNEYQVAEPQNANIAGQQGRSYSFQGVSQATGKRFQGVILFVPTQRGTLGVGIWGDAGTNDWNKLQQAVIAQTKLGGGQ